MATRSEAAVTLPARTPRNWPRYVVLVLAVSMLALLVFGPRPPERISLANFHALRRGMSRADLRDLFGPPQYESLELGLVTGPDRYTVNFAETNAQKRARGFQEYLRQQWMSPEITITVITDDKEKVVCLYRSGGQAVGWVARLREWVSNQWRIGERFVQRL